MRETLGMSTQVTAQKMWMKIVWRTKFAIAERESCFCFEGIIISAPKIPRSNHHCCLQHFISIQQKYSEWQWYLLTLPLEKFPSVDFVKFSWDRSMACTVKLTTLFQAQNNLHVELKMLHCQEMIWLYVMKFRRKQEVARQELAGIANFQIADT